MQIIVPRKIPYKIEVILPCDAEVKLAVDVYAEQKLCAINHYGLEGRVPVLRVLDDRFGPTTLT